jgi:predicted DsbA family dithiol-disulfide isomerase
MKDPETDARIHADGEAFRAAHGHGLPTLYIDGTKLEGAQERTVLTRALDAAIRAL